MEEKINKPKKSKLEILCYVWSAILLVSAIFMMTTNVLYIADYMSSYGYGFIDMWSDFLQYLIAGFMPYFTYSLLAFCAARVIGHINKNCVEEKNEVTCGLIEETEMIEEEKGPSLEE